MKPEQLLLIGQGWLDVVVLAGFAVATVWIAFTKPHRILYLIPAAQTCFFFVELGTRWTPEKFVPILFLVLLLLNQRDKIRIFDFKDGWYQVFVFTLTTSTIWGLLLSDNFNSSQYTSSFQSPFIRTLIQCSAYVNWLLIYKIVRYYCNSISRILAFSRAYLVTTTLLCSYGFYQLLAIYLKLPLRGIVYSARKVGMGVFGSNAGIIYRINSLAIEPKQFSFILAISIVLLIVLLNLSKKRPEFRLFDSHVLILLILIHIFCLLSTYSTSAYLALAIFIAIYLISGAIQGQLDKNLFYFMSFLGVILVTVYFYFGEDFLSNIIDARLNNQFNTRRVELFAVDLVLEKPEYMIIGFGPGNYNFVLQQAFPGEAGVFEEGSLDVISSQILTILFDLGILGLLVLWSPVYRAIAANFSSNFQINLIDKFFSTLFLIVACIALFLNPTGIYMAFLGAYRGIQVTKNNS